MLPIRARPLSEPKVRSTSSRSLGRRTSSEAKDDTSLNDFPFIGRSFCLVEWMDVSALHIFRFRTSLSDELCLFAILSPRLSVSVCLWTVPKLGAGLRFVLNLFFLASPHSSNSRSPPVSSVVEVMDTCILWTKIMIFHLGSGSLKLVGDPIVTGLVFPDSDRGVLSVIKRTHLQAIQRHRSDPTDSSNA